jgi:hypothetical protein
MSLHELHRFYTVKFIQLRSSTVPMLTAQAAIMHAVENDLQHYGYHNC